MLLVQLRKALCPSTYVEIVRPMSRDPLYLIEIVYTGEAQRMPIMYDERRIDQIGTCTNKFDNPEIVIMLEY